jgi:predicted metal-dependent enzyme (double-stranded beta helix superfamily)
MIGVMGNAIQETRFRRVDDRTLKGHATLEKDRAVLVKPGEVTLLIPDQDEIHQLDNFSDQTTVEIHVYGRDLVGLERCRYDLETGAISTYVLGKYDNC